MEEGLKKSLSPLQLWGIIVGMVISGMYFGWNYALQVTSPIGFIIAVLIVTLFYTTFIFSYAELSTAIPHAGGPSEYANRAMGPLGGFLAGFACLVEFVFATPAIALGIGGYINFLFPVISVVVASVVVYGIFIFINCLGVKTAALVELVVTIIAIGGIVIFASSGATHVNISNITSNMNFGGWKGIFAAIPFAIWFYLAVEGGAMAAEECKDAKKDIPKGFILGIATLVILTLATLIFSIGAIGVDELMKADSPLPAVLKMIYGSDSMLPNIMSFIGMFGLAASIHGIIMAYSRQTFAMSRAGYLPKFLSYTDKNKTPILAIIIPSLVGIIFLLTGQTSTIIVISCFGAVGLYIISLISLFILRKNEPKMNRPFKVYYPVVPAIALAIACVFLVAITYFNLSTISWVIGNFATAIVFYFLYSKKNIDTSISTEVEILAKEA